MTCTVGAMLDLERDIGAIAEESRFSGALRIDRRDEVVERAYGLARRDTGAPNTPETQFATASGLKGMTALAVMCLVEDGVLALGTTARSILGDDLPLIADDVTVEHLLAHRSGIGDYLDEDEGGYDVTDHVIPVPVHTLLGPEDYLAILDGHPTKFAAGSDFAYCNGGFVVLALIAERASGVPYHDLVTERVCRPAGMADTAFLRSDELPGRAALGYLSAEGPRTNVLHLPVRGTGDGGIYTTVADMRSFWQAFVSGRIVSRESVDEMTRSRSVIPRASGGTRGYGLGFWLRSEGDGVILVGSDAGVSLFSIHAPDADVTYTVVSNCSDGAWDLAGALEARLFA
jgi:CubicO group peptidase (beta-lactamase class C family)